MEYELESLSNADALAHRLREADEVAEVIERNPELAGLPDWFDAAQRLLMDLDALDTGDLDDIL